MEDKNTWIGFGLIAAIFIGFSLFNRPSKEELARRQHYRDSIALVQSQMAAEAAAMAQLQEAADMAQTAEVLHELNVQRYGAFAQAAVGEEAEYVVENEVLRLTFGNKGGVLRKAELKNYKAYGDSVNPLRLFGPDEVAMGYTIALADNKMIRDTKDMFFVMQPVQTGANGEQIVTMRLLSDTTGHIDFVYTIPQNDYMIGFAIRCVNAAGLLAQNYPYMEMYWNQTVPQHERGRKFEERYARLQYMFVDGDIEQLSEQKDDNEEENTRIRWIAYKDQFFSTVLIANNEGFDGAQLHSKVLAKKTGGMKSYSMTSQVPFDPTGAKETGFRMYLGPNHYNTLKAYDEGVERQDRLNLKELVPLGWKIVAWVNKILVIPMFDLFTSWGMSIGLIILLMTIVIKLIILPFTFKSYTSTAKMRALKPQIDEINKRIPEEKMQERQQATMALYSKAGVNPMAGCLPMLFQMPVVMAMFWFFPTAIELRGQSFLWAPDLSTYDTLFSWNKDLWLIGDHISLFTLLFSGVNILYTYVTMQTQPGADGPQANMMKWMMYLMPLMFFFIFNDYAAGLSYYYFLSLLFSILQTMIFRWTLDDKKMLAEMEKQQAKRANKKKSGWAAKLEQLQKEQEARMREQIKQQSKQQYR
ncbi:MAG: membrane protein insertase YidC [Paludibacteraceae bacterium]|nr:membrane protein insertase YidC [Paludibacteraceae bacterium]